MITAKECMIGGPTVGLFRFIPKERVDEFSWKGKAAGHRTPPKRVNQKHAHKINDRELDAIRYLYLEAGVTQCALATAFCLNQGTVSKIVRGIYHPYEVGDFISETRPTGRACSLAVRAKEDIPEIPGLKEADLEAELKKIEDEGNDASAYIKEWEEAHLEEAARAGKL